MERNKHVRLRHETFWQTHCVSNFDLLPLSTWMTWVAQVHWAMWLESFPRGYDGSELVQPQSPTQSPLWPKACVCERAGCFQGWDRWWRSRAKKKNGQHSHESPATGSSAVCSDQLSKQTLACSLRKTTHWGPLAPGQLCPERPALLHRLPKTKISEKQGSQQPWARNIRLLCSITLSTIGIKMYLKHSFLKLILFL